MTRILVVDDEPSLRITLKAFLERDGYEVDVAADVDAALKLFSSVPYDIVLTDIIMPKSTGIELLARIRAVSRQIQVIVMTGEPTVETAIRAVQNGANDYLTKPIDRATLLMTVRQAAEVKTLHDEKTLLETERREYLKELESLVEERTAELQATMQGVVLLMSAAVELRDPYTAGHQRRVGNLSAAIAKQLGHSPEFINNVRICGYLHDIAKLVVPAEILSKPGRLNEFEMGIIRYHAQQGYEMLRQVNLPGRIADIVHQHHERLDGTGYPQGLMGAEILEEACILAVADVVEAVMSHRPYRPALGLDFAMGEISAHAGSHYRNDVVDACKKLFLEDAYVLDDEAHRIMFPVTGAGGAAGARRG